MRQLALCLLCVLLAACGEKRENGKALTHEELLNPESCKSCHPKHYREWRASMHAYASLDPVFIAMNRRGQRETQGELGDFCVRCHAPMVVRELELKGKEFGDLSALPDHLQGVTCYFCHNAVGVDNHFNGDLKLAGDTVMRGAITNPVEQPAHRAEYSQFHDRAKLESSTLCGSCHDIVTPKGVHLERTFQEYQTSVFAKPTSGFSSCQSCHMDGEPGVSADFDGVPQRVVHEHLWPGVDVALTDFPERDAMRAAVQECALPNSISFFELTPVSGPADDAPPLPGAFYVRVTLETNAAHNQPSGASHDRRMWLELTAYDENDQVLFSTGSIDDRGPEELPEGDPKHDPHLWLFRDRAYDEGEREVHMFWDAARYDDTKNPTLPAPVTAIQGGHSLSHVYFIGAAPKRITARIRMRPVGLDVLHDLVASNDLDPSIVDEMPTFTVDSREFLWDDTANPTQYSVTIPTYPDCQSYRCLLDPGSDRCAAGR
jgi:hypothetical protein